MANKVDFLLEIGTAEIPAVLLTKISSQLARNFKDKLNSHDIAADIKIYSTPRRIAIIANKMDDETPAKNVTRKGPALKHAYDSEQKPTKACEGFARSLGISTSELIIDKKLGAVTYNQVIKSKPIASILPDIIIELFSSLTSVKGMRWGSFEKEFIRPIYWIVALLEQDIIPLEVYGITSSNISQGHRDHGDKEIIVKSPGSYLQQMEDNYVITDSDIRKQLIHGGIDLISKKNNSKCNIDEILLEEVNGLVEYPVPLFGKIEERFMTLPIEVLETTIKYHQKCFPLQYENGNSFPGFIFVSNIKSKDEKILIHCNEQVMHARLSDAEFFFSYDQKRDLEYYNNALRSINMHIKLGSVHDQSMRLSTIIKHFIVDDNLIKDAKRAGILAKFDLATNMVGEFPELQGIMGGHYSKCYQESPMVSNAISEQYMPVKLEDAIPKTEIGAALALAYRFDHMVGYFGINVKPKGDKDPFALRRAALIIVRIILERKLDLNLKKIIQDCYDAYEDKLNNKNCLTEVLEYIQDRLKRRYVSKGINADIIDSVLAMKLDNLLDIDSRIEAVNEFMKLESALSLASSNKRVRRILLKAEYNSSLDINTELLKEEPERRLYQEIERIQKLTRPLLQERKFQEILQISSTLRENIDTFFDKVMVMDDDVAIRNNRLCLLLNLQNIFLQVADISLISAE